MPARWIVGLVGLALVVAPGCSGESGDGVGSSVDSVPLPTEPSGPSSEVAVDSADSGLALSLSDLVVGSDGRVYVTGPAGVAARAPDGAWGALDVAQLPAGSGSPWPLDWPTGWPGRDIGLVEVGPDGRLWVAGVSFSSADDERFGGELNPWFDARFLHWVAVGRCDAAGTCEWEVFDSDDVPGLAVRALAVGSDGAAYVASDDGAILVFDGDSWTAHAAPSGDIESLAVTADGVLWAGATAGGGLFSFDGTEFTSHSLDDVVTGAEEITVGGAHGATVWVSADTMNGSGTGTVLSFDGTGWVVHDESDGMWSDYAGIAVGSGDVVWGVHDEAGHGYSRYEGARWTGFPSTQPVGGGGEVAPDGTLWTIAIDPDHADATPEAWLVSFDGTSETVHDSPFTGAPQSGTIAVALEEVTGLVDHRLLALAWHAPYADLVGAAFWMRADSDPFSARDVVHPPDWSNGPDSDDDRDGWAADDYRWEETATLRPGTYRVDVYAQPGELNPYGRHLPAEPIDRQCFVEVDVRAGETTVVTISDVPVTAEPSTCAGATSGRQPASAADAAPERTLVPIPEEEPVVAATVIGDLVFTSYSLPSDLLVFDVAATSFGFLMIAESELLWSAHAQTWFSTPLPSDATQVMTVGDDILLVGEGHATRFAWNGSAWTEQKQLDLPVGTSSLVVGPRGTVAYGSNTIYHATDDHDFAKAELGPRRDMFIAPEWVPEEDRDFGDCRRNFEAMTNRIDQVFATDAGFVALTSAARSDAVCEPLLWFSTDGNKWELVSDRSPFGHLSDVFIDGHTGIAERDGRYMAIGEIGGQGVADIRSATWASDDGLTWTTIDLPLERVEQLVTGEMGWMLSGVDHTGADRDDAWFSLDGLAWDGPYPLPDGFSGLRPGWIPAAHAVGPEAIISVGGADNRSVLIVGRELDPET